MKADKTSLELAIIEAYAHLEDSKPSPTDGGTTFSRYTNGVRNWTVPVTLVPLGGRFAAHIDCPPGRVSPAGQAAAKVHVLSEDDRDGWVAEATEQVL